MSTNMRHIASAIAIVGVAFFFCRCEQHREEAKLNQVKACIENGFEPEYTWSGAIEWKKKAK